MFAYSVQSENCNCIVLTKVTCMHNSALFRTVRNKGQCYFPFIIMEYNVSCNTHRKERMQRESFKGLLPSYQPMKLNHIKCCDQMLQIN